MACGPITFPNYRLVPDTRWMLDAPRTAVGARSARRRDRGVAVFTVGRETLRRYGFADGASPLTNVPDPGLRPGRARAAPQRVRGVSGSALTIPSSRSRSHNGAFWCSAVCASAHARSPVSGSDRVPAAARSAATHASGPAAVVTASDQVATPASGGATVRRPRRAYFEDPVGQPGVVERLDLERDDADVRTEDEARRLLVGLLAEPDDVRRRTARRVVLVAGHLVVVPRADEEQDELRHPLGDRPQERPVGPAPEVPEGHGDDGPGRVGRREEVGRQRHELGGAPLLALELGEAHGGGDRQRRPLRGRLVVGGEPRAALRRRVVGVVEAVPAPVPELGVLAARPGVEERPGQRPLDGMEDDDDPRPAAPEQRPHEALGRPARDEVRHRVRHPQRRAVRDGRRIRGHDAAVPGADPAPGRAG